MSKLIRFAKGLNLPIEAVTQTFAIVARKGAGKTYAGMKLAEQMMEAGQQVICADPLGVWWGLRSSADGKSAGYPVIIMGGAKADVPLSEDSGRVVADFVYEQGASIILDMSHMRKAAMVRFMTNFAEALFEAAGYKRTPIHLFLDEAHTFAPQRFEGDKARMLGAIEDIGCKGRSRGLGLTMMCQRPSMLNKNVLSQAEVLIAMQMAGKHDRKAIDEWVEANGTDRDRRTMMESLASLEVGEAWIWSPSWLRHFGRHMILTKTTFDSSATPKIGKAISQPRKRAQVNLDELRGKMKDSIEKAVQNDPKVLRTRVTDLERRLRTAENARPALETKRVEVPILTAKQEKRLERLIEKLEKLHQDAVVTLNRASSTLEFAKEEFAVIKSNLGGVTVPTETPVRTAAPARLIQTPPCTPPAATNWLRDDTAPLLKGERRMLEVLARRNPLKLTRSQLGTLSGLSPKGGTFGTYFGKLKKAGLIHEQAGEVIATENGMGMVGIAANKPLDREEAREMWRRNILAGERRMMDRLLETYPNWMTREELGRDVAIVHTGGTFGTYLGTLKRNGLAEINGKEVRAGEALFI